MSTFREVNRRKLCLLGVKCSGVRRCDYSGHEHARPRWLFAGVTEIPTVMRGAMPDKSVDVPTRDEVSLHQESPRKKESYKALWLLLLLLVLAGAGTYAWRGTRKGQPSRATDDNAAARRGVPVTVTVAQRRDLPVYLDGLGTVEAFNTVTVTLGEAVNAIENVEHTLGLPGTIHPGFQGTAQAFQASLATEPYLILAALMTVYIVLGVLYEDYVHPLTILSTLPPAGVGALLALLLFHTELNIIGLIGIILLIGIVKKNAILMIDFAIAAERNEGNNPLQSIYQACLMRFRPIMMTTMAALFGGVPMAVATGNGAELRRPLGIAIVGGLLLSQILTLYTTPVVYLYLDRFRIWVSGGEKLRPIGAPVASSHA